MNENRRQILEMLAAGKITADEADRLLAALEPDLATPLRDFANTASAQTGDKFGCLLYTSPSPRDLSTSRMPSSA